MVLYVLMSVVCASATENLYLTAQLPTKRNVYRKEKPANCNCDNCWNWKVKVKLVIKCIKYGVHNFSVCRAHYKMLNIIARDLLKSFFSCVLFIILFIHVLEQVYLLCHWWSIYGFIQSMIDYFRSMDFVLYLYIKCAPRSLSQKMKHCFCSITSLSLWLG